MARRSLIVSVEITTAGRAHDCRYNKNHRLEKGDAVSLSGRTEMSIIIALPARRASSRRMWNGSGDF